MRIIRRAACCALLMLVLMVESGASGAKKGKRNKQKKAAAQDPPGSASKQLPTAQGWAHGDTITPVQEIFATASALAQQGDYALSAEGFGQVLRIRPNNAIARVNFATMIDKAGHPTLALTHFEQVIEAPNVDIQTKMTARHRYGVLQLSEATYMCTEKDRSAERDSDQCVAEKVARLEKGVHYLKLLLHDARADAGTDADAATSRQATMKLMSTEHRRLLAQALVQLDRKVEAQAVYENLRSIGRSGSTAVAGWETALYTFEYGQLLESQSQTSQAERVYEEALAMNDPQAHARLCALENPLHRTVLHCLRILEILPEDQHSSPNIRQVYTMLGKGYALLGMLAEEQDLYIKGKELGVYRDIQQRCQLRVDVDLDETETADLSAMYQHPVPDWRRFDAYRKAVALLEGAAADIRNEFLSVVGGASALDSGTSSGGFSLDVENLTSTGTWRQRTYMKDGQVISHAAGQGASFATAFPFTVDVVERVLRLGELGGIGSKLPESSVEMSLLAPGTHIKRHCGPSNHKWRLHLPLVVPVEEGTVRLRVSDITLHWEMGKVLLFDDSFEHEVWNDAETTRAVLIVDLWHPELDEDARTAVRKHFGTGAGTTAAQMQRL